MQKRYVLIEKAVGETPLVALEEYRSTHPELAHDISAENFWMQMPLVQGLRQKSRIWLYGNESNMPKQGHMRQKYPPMAYAGRLDPMASGKLLILIGDECKKQERYHALDKEYEFSILFGISSDTGDVLGRLDFENTAPKVGEADLRRVAHTLTGPITLPYPHFSSKTVGGKPLHVWTLENRINEIEIPTYSAEIYKLSLKNIVCKSGNEITEEALSKIETIPPVTEESKALGRDFRRDDVRHDWKKFREKYGEDTYTIATFTCICSSGLYMRSLAEVIAEKLDTRGLAPTPTLASFCDDVTPSKNKLPQKNKVGLREKNNSKTEQRQSGCRGLAYSIHRSEIGTYRKLWGLGFWTKRF